MLVHVCVSLLNLLETTVQWEDVWSACVLHCDIQIKM